MKYRCKEGFSVNKYDEDGRSTESSMEIASGSLWEVDEKASILGGEVHIKNRESLEWLELSREALNELFEPVYTREELLQIAKPVLFNTDMVRAILEGRKTVTRRVLKLPSHIKQNENGLYTLFAEGTCYENQSMEEIKEYIKPPFKKGDYLYVRETWHVCKGKYIYKAGFNKGLDALPLVKWRPSIHMPKEAARIFLKIMHVRVERLQDMQEVDFYKEGIESYKEDGRTEKTEIEKEYEFSDLWDSTIKKVDLDTYGWDANPWVWMIAFERVEV